MQGNIKKKEQEKRVVDMTPDMEHGQNKLIKAISYTDVQKIMTPKSKTQTDIVCVTVYTKLLSF